MAKYGQYSEHRAIQASASLKRVGVVDTTGEKDLERQDAFAKALAEGGDSVKAATSGKKKSFAQALQDKAALTKK